MRETREKKERKKDRKYINMKRERNMRENMRGK